MTRTDFIKTRRDQFGEEFPSKICSACNTEQLLMNFSPSYKGLYGCVSQCKPCRNERLRIARKANPEITKKRNRDQHAKHAIKRRAYARKWNSEHPENRRENQKRYSEKNSEIYRLRTKEWTRKNKTKKIAHNKQREKRIQLAMPYWADKKELVAFYMARPDGYEVDHIIPLRGKTPEGWDVCGLHVIWNLQYLQKADNRRKYRNVQNE